MQTLSKIVHYLNRALILIGGVFLVAMILLTCGNIFLRAVVAPIRGTFELMGFFGAVVAAFSLGYTQLNRGHISVDFLIQKFSARTRKVLTALNSAVCALFFALVSWQVVEKAHVIRISGEVTETLRIIYHPFTYGVAVGCAFLCLVFAKDLLSVFFPKAGKEGR